MGIGIWTQKALKSLISDKLGDNLLIVVSNREPYLHVYQEGEIKCVRPASGLVTALNPVMQSSGGVWIAHGSGSADRKTVDVNNKIQLPPEKPSYTLKRVWLTKEEEAGYYYGFSNETFWPLCHISYVRPIFSESHWEYYKKANQIFAEAVAEEIRDNRVIVWIQDYHFALLPKMIKEIKPDVTIAQFWHIPWPNPEVFRICPWKRDILEGLLSNNILGFHLRYHCDNFLDTIARELEARVDREHSAVIYKGNTTYIKPFPISVDFKRISIDSDNSEIDNMINSIKKNYSLDAEFIAIGLDRIDYTKGIPERLMAIDRFLEKYQEYQKRFIFCQAGTPSRIHIPAYKDLNEKIDNLTEEINWKYSTDSWSPVILIKKHISYPEILAFYRMSTFCIVSSLHDGMNLVAKEFVSARNDLNGVLILSRFTGAARELRESVLINPYDTENFADGIKAAIEMGREEKKKRMGKLRETIRVNNIYRWASDLITSLADISKQNLS